MSRRPFRSPCRPSGGGRGAVCRVGGGRGGGGRRGRRGGGRCVGWRGVGGEGEVGEVGVLVGGCGPGGVVAAEEGGEEQALDAELVGGAELQAGVVEDEVVVLPDGDAAVVVSGGVELDAL